MLNNFCVESVIEEGRKDKVHWDTVVHVCKAIIIGLLK